MKRFAILCALLVAPACNTLSPLHVDPCMVIPDEIRKCRAIPLNQPDKLEYDRFIGPYDVCFTIEEYAEVQKYNRHLESKCGGE